jgi:hypothetical protein
LHPPLAVTGRAGGLAGGCIQAFAATNSTSLLVADLDWGFNAIGRVHEIKVDGIIEVFTLLWSFVFFAAAGALAGDITENGLKDIAKRAVPGAVEIKTFEIAAPAAAVAGTAVSSQGTVQVVLFLFFRILEGFVGFVHLLEFLFGRLVARVQVGVVFAGQFTVGFFYVGDTGVFVNAQDLIVVFHTKNFTLRADKNQ